MIHVLKTLPEHFNDVLNKGKLNEVRFNDRDFKVNDILRLREYDPTKKTDLEIEKYTGNQFDCRVIHILKNFPEGLKENYIVMSIIQISGTYKLLE
jgi:hypothetical protein